MLNPVTIHVLSAFLHVPIVILLQTVPPVPILFITTTLPVFLRAPMEPSRIPALAHFVTAHVLLVPFLPPIALHVPKP